MTATANGPSSFLVDNNPASEAAQAFWDKHGRLLTEVQFLADFYAANADCDSMLLLDAALLGICQRIRDHLQRMGVEVQPLPPSIGDELSAKLR
jgi:hypothetical protein